jgi:hypothetical protein
MQVVVLVLHALVLLVGVTMREQNVARGAVTRQATVPNRLVCKLDVLVGPTLVILLGQNPYVV